MKKFKSHRTAGMSKYMSAGDVTLQRENFSKLNEEQIKQIQEQYKKSLYTTAYSKHYGHWEFDFADTSILKFKSLSETSAASEVLNSRMKSYLDKWMSLGET